MGANPTRSMGPSTTIGHTSTETGLRVSEIEMPMFGLGVYLMKEPGECKSAVVHAIKSGYRLIDTAMAYGNEHEVGDAVAIGIFTGTVGDVAGVGNHVSVAVIGSGVVEGVVGGVLPVVASS